MARSPAFGACTPTTRTNALRWLAASEGEWAHGDWCAPAAASVEVVLLGAEPVLGTPQILEERGKSNRMLTHNRRSADRRVSARLFPREARQLAADNRLQRSKRNPFPAPALRSRRPSSLLRPDFRLIGDKEVGRSAHGPPSTAPEPRHRMCTVPHTWIC